MKLRMFITLTTWVNVINNCAPFLFYKPAVLYKFTFNFAERKVYQAFTNYKIKNAYNINACGQCYRQLCTSLLYKAAMFY